MNCHAWNIILLKVTQLLVLTRYDCVMGSYSLRLVSNCHSKWKLRTFLGIIVANIWTLIGNKSNLARRISGMNSFALKILSISPAREKPNKLKKRLKEYVFLGFWLVHYCFVRVFFKFDWLLKTSKTLIWMDNWFFLLN